MKMLQLNTLDNIQLILEEYLDYLKVNVEIKGLVRERYYRDIEFYFYNVILNKSDSIKGFSNFLYPDFIIELYEMRTGDTVYPAINHLLSFLNFTERISREDYLKINDFISKLRPKRPESIIEYVGQEHVEFMFSNRVQYVFDKSHKRDYSHYQLIAPLIWSLAYECGFEQKHILNLLVSDIDLENYRIRNLRTDKNSMGVEYIELGARTFHYLQVYSKDRPEHLKTKKLLVVNDAAIEMSDINKTFDILNRKENKHNFIKKVSIEMLVRSGILKSLYDTNGISLIKQTMIHGADNNGQLTHAIKAYLIQLQ